MSEMQRTYSDVQTDENTFLEKDAKENAVIANDVTAEETTKSIPQKRRSARIHVKQGLKKKWRKPSKTAILGFLVLFFAAIGLVSTGRLIVKTTYDIIDNKGQKTAFEEYIYPMVMLDPPPFEDPQKLEPTTALTAAIWNLVLNEDTAKYPKDEFSFMQVPQTDVEAYAVKLFGTGLKLTHQPVGDTEFNFEYDAEGKTYTVPSTIVIPQQMPKVTRIKREGKVYRLSVDYIPTGALWTVDQEGVKQEPDSSKTMIYSLEKEGKSYKIISVQDSRGAASSVGSEDTSSATSTESEKKTGSSAA